MYAQGNVTDAIENKGTARVRSKSCTLHQHLCSAPLTQRLLVNHRTDGPLLHLLSYTIYIAQADARAVALAKRRVRLETRVLAKFQKHGLASLTTDDVTVILEQAYRVGDVVSLEGCNAAWNGGTLDWS